MSDEISAAPVPWKVADQYWMRDARDIRDANGALVAVGVSSADARLIVDAVNERERLRTEVKEAGELLQTWLCEAPGHRETVAWLKRNGFDDPFPECTEEDSSQ